MKIFTAIFLLISSLTLSQTTYIWTGAVNSNFSTAGNWSPFRQVGLANDILVFENGGSIVVTNTNQVTIGQLIIRNNTNLTLSPSSGNPKTISIKGAAGEDFIIASGSSLKISGNDPKLSIYILEGASASINGTLTFQGSASHNLNSAESNAIVFKSGSVLNQLCPGNMFNNTGVSNAVIFEEGSVFTINHTDALSPFGLQSPESKALFEEGSRLILYACSAFSMNGRTLADLVIEQGCIANVSEQITSDITIGSLTVKNGGILNFTNTNVRSGFVPKLNIKGNIKVEGELKFDGNHNRLNVVLNGNKQQVIEGNGVISLPYSLYRFTIDNDIMLQRNLNVSCSYSHLSGTIDYNNFEIFSFSSIGPELNENSGSENNTDVITNNSLPQEFTLSQNYPNPFNPSTKINFSLPKSSHVSLRVFDVNGKEVAVLVNSQIQAGYHTVNFNAGSLSSGIYFYTIKVDNFIKTLKMILVR